MFKRDVKPLGDIVLHCLRQDGLETPLMQKRILDSWDKVAGRTIAKYTGEKFIKNQTLFIKILNPALRANLSMMREELFNRLCQHIDGNVITEIRFF